MKDQVVQIDISRIDAFNIYDALGDVVIFSEARDAREDAIKEYVTERAGQEPKDSPRMFKEHQIKPSNDAELKKRYGDGNVSMQTDLIPITFQVEISQEELASLSSGPLKDSYQLPKSKKELLTFQMAILHYDVVFYLTAKYAQDQQSETTMSMIDHDQLAPSVAVQTSGSAPRRSRNNGCAVM